jgi:cytochrome c-type biogenesis protein CcmE
MNQNKMRFAGGVAVIVIAIAYFAVSGFEEGKAYYKTLDELEEMGPTADGKRLRVAGLVQAGSIERVGPEVSFVLEFEGLTLPVHYSGSQPLPDTFKDGVDAMVEGERLADGTFEADHIQAKCASKYEAEYGDAAPEGQSDA